MKTISESMRDTMNRITEIEGSHDAVLEHLNIALQMIEEAGPNQGEHEQYFLQAHEQLSAIIDMLGQLG